MQKSKEPIRLRQRKMATGNISLYLDVYINGRRSYEYLHLYLIPEKSRKDKEKNRETLQLAEAIRAKRVVEMRNGMYGFKKSYSKNTRFYDYFLAETEKRNEKSNWKACYNMMKMYDGRDNITFEDITLEWIMGFKEYLEKKACAWAHDNRERVKDRPLARNSMVQYFSKLRTCLNKAHEDGILETFPMRGMNIKKEETERTYLTIEEVKKLAQTECEYPNIKDAFLFSCLTGLRRSDVEKLTWSEVQKFGQYTRIVFKQKKTGGLEYLDITKEAEVLMGERGNEDERVFHGLHTKSFTNTVIGRWATSAGIKKHITFHCARHTFATMMLTLGTDIYTVSKLLGHRALSTTQVYAKVLDKSKQEAVSKIPSILSEDRTSPDQ